MPVSKAQIVLRKHTFLGVFKMTVSIKTQLKTRRRCSFLAYRVNAYKVNCAKAAMADLSEISEEFFRILLEEELRDLGVLQAPRSNSVGHNG